MLAALPCSLIPLLHNETGLRSVHCELLMWQLFLWKMSLQSSAKCGIHGIIRYLIWKGKTPVEVYNEVKTTYGYKAMNRTSVFSSHVMSLKMVVRLWMMTRGVKDLQFTKQIEEKSKMRSLTITDWLWMNFLQISATRSHHSNPQISENVREVHPKIVNRPTQV
jgi:hypothetical protein